MIGWTQCGQLPHGVRRLGKGGHRYRYIPAGRRAENSCRAPICRNERDRVCRGGGWWRLQESPRLSLAGGPGGKSGAVVRVRKRGKKGPPVPPLRPSRPPHPRPSLAHTRTQITSWLQGPSRDREQVGLGRGGVCACVGRRTGTGRDRDAPWEGCMDGSGCCRPLFGSWGHLLTRTLVPFGAVGYCYFRKGGFPVSHTRTPSLLRQGRWLVGNCTRCSPRMYRGTHARGKRARRAGRGEGRFWRKAPARMTVPTAGKGRGGGEPWGAHSSHWV